MAETNTNENKKENAKRCVFRRSTRVDLTPMVDLGFLLITFFVFTTSMAQAKAMAMVTPIEGPPKNVSGSGAMTIIIAGGHTIFYYYGLLDEANTMHKIKTTNFKDIRSLILQKKQNTNTQKLMYVLKSRDDATYGDAINLLDEMSICNVPLGHYVETELADYEKKIIDKMEKIR